MWFDSLTYGTHHPYEDYNVIQTPETCWSMVRKKKICPPGGPCFNIKMGETSSHAYHPEGHGYLHKDGKCETGDFVVNGIRCVNSYERRVVTVTIEKVDAIVHEASGQALFFDKVRTPYNKKSFQDS